jgi:hypothetical protein
MDVPSVTVSIEKADLIASLRAKAKRERELAEGVVDEMEEGEVLVDKSLILDLDELSSSDDEDMSDFADKTPHRLSHAETLQRLQSMIEEKELAKVRANRPEDLGLLSTKVAAQESLLARVSVECRDLNRQKTALVRKVEKTHPNEVIRTRNAIAKQNAKLLRMESMLSEILRNQDEARAQLVAVQNTLAEKIEMQKGLREKLAENKKKLDELRPRPPTEEELERARWLMAAFSAADPMSETLLRASFGMVWTTEAREQCARVFCSLGEKSVLVSEEEGLSSKPRGNLSSLLEPYRSPLLPFHSYRLTSAFAQVMGEAAISHVTFSNLITPGTPLCRFELSGVCNDEHCPFLHERDYVLNTNEKLFGDLVKYAETDKPQQQLQRKFLAFLTQSGSLNHAVSSVLKNTDPTSPSFLHSPVRPLKKLRPATRKEEVEEVDEEEVEPAEPVVSLRKRRDAADERFFGTVSVSSEAGLAETIEELRTRHPTSVDRWIQLAQVVADQHDDFVLVVDEGIQCNPTSWKLWVLYLEAIALDKTGLEKKQIEIVFECASQYLPMCVPIWVMYLDWCTEFQAREQLSRRALHYIKGEMDRAPENVAAGQSALFQVLLYRLQLLLEAGRTAEELAAESSEWQSSLSVWQVVNLKLLLCSVKFEAVQIANVTHRFFSPAQLGERDYVVLELPANADEALLDRVCRQILSDDMECFLLGMDLATRMPLRVNLIRVKMLQGDRSVAQTHLQDLLSACPMHPDVHWLASRVFLADESVSPLLEARFVFAFGRMLQKLESHSSCAPALPLAPASDENLSEAEQVGWKMMNLLSLAWEGASKSSAASAFGEARVWLRPVCGAAAMAVLHMAHVAFLSGQSSALPFQSAIAVAKSDLVIPSGAMKSASRCVFDSKKLSTKLPEDVIC